MKRSIGNPKHYPYAPILRPLPHPVERVTALRHAVKRPPLARTRRKRIRRNGIINKMSRKLFFLLSPSAVLFYFLFTVRVPHKKTINLLFTDHQEIVSRRGLFTTHVLLVARAVYEGPLTQRMIHFYLPHECITPRSTLLALGPWLL